MKTSLKFCSVNVWTTALVNSSTEKKRRGQQREQRREVDDDEPEQRSASTRAQPQPRVPETAQADSRRRGRRPAAAAWRLPRPARRRLRHPAGRSAVAQVATSAFDQSAYGMHLVSVRPSRQSLCGVVQNQIFLKYVSSVAW